MNNENELMKAKAQSIYNDLLKDPSTALEALVLQFSMDYSDDPIMPLEEWVEEFKNSGNIYDLIQIAQKSEGLDVYDDYIRAGVYYESARTSTSALDLVEEEEVVEWIAAALKDDPKSIEEFYEDESIEEFYDDNDSDN